MNLSIPELSLVVLIGPSGSGKSTFAAKHFLATEIISSDRCRGMVCDDENSLSATQDAFDLVHHWAGLRLKRGKRAVIDATSVQQTARASLVKLAKSYHARVVAIVLDVPEELCLARNQARPDRTFGPHVVRGQHRDMRRSIKHLKKEGFHHVYRLQGEEAVNAATIEFLPMWPDRRWERGPFDIIGDIHGCFDETLALLGKLGYQVTEEGEGDAARFSVRHPDKRRVIFLGDLVDRGPASHRVLRLAMDMVETGIALCVPGNHENKLERWLAGRRVKLTYGLETTVNQLQGESEAFRQRVRTFINSLVSHLILEDGRLIVAHAGMKESMAGRASAAVRSFALYGETSGETDSYGLPVRYDWAAEYRGKAAVVYGHTPVPTATWVNRTICLDTGCVFGGKLTALRWPERELVEEKAHALHYEPVRPLVAADEDNRPGASTFYLDDVRGKRIINTRFNRQITIREQYSMAAVEVISRFAIDPRLLTYMPATMAPPETSRREGYLEHPEEAFAYYRKKDIEEVICQEKHMGSRAVIQVCRDVTAARHAFNLEDDVLGTVYTRSGRRFFTDAALEQAFLARMAAAIEKAGLWRDLATDRLTLDCEIMPWSAKGLDLLKNQYARVGAAASAAIPATISALSQATERGLELADKLADWQNRADNLDKYRRAYGTYCWATDGLQGLRVAPFHVLASEGHAHFDKDHLWHMDMAERLADADPELVQKTQYRRLNLADSDAEAAVTDWWCAMTEAGGEGMVVKPIPFMAVCSENRLVLPAIKCRGRDYLRIIYGPDYTEPEQLERLRQRGLTLKHRNAVREWALGMEGLARWAEGDGISRVHECVIAVAALETEPIDPRL